MDEQRPSLFWSSWYTFDKGHRNNGITLVEVLFYDAITIGITLDFSKI